MAPTGRLAYREEKESAMNIPMDFLIRAGQGEVAETLREYADRRLAFALRPFAHRLQSLTLRLVDTNGPRGGVDARCAITATLADGRRIFVKATAAWPTAAITSAAGRLKAAIRRQSGQHRVCVGT